MGFPSRLFCVKPLEGKRGGEDPRSSPSTIAVPRGLDAQRSGRVETATGQRDAPRSARDRTTSQHGGPVWSVVRVRSPTIAAPQHDGSRELATRGHRRTGSGPTRHPARGRTRHLNGRHARSRRRARMLQPSRLGRRSQPAELPGLRRTPHPPLRERARRKQRQPASRRPWPGKRSPNLSSDRTRQPLPLRRPVGYRPVSTARRSIYGRSRRRPSVTLNSSRRQYVAPVVTRVLPLLGFRYSRARDACVLRGVGRRVGPVVASRDRKFIAQPARDQRDWYTVDRDRRS